MIGKEENEDFLLFMGYGKTVFSNGYQIATEETGNVILEYKNGSLILHNEVPATFGCKNSKKHFVSGSRRMIELK